MNIFSHSGDLGDIIWSLPTIRCAGGGILELFPTPGKTREQMTQKKCDLIRPLLMQQPYIHDVVFKEQTTDSSLNGFRAHLKDKRTLADAHLASMGFVFSERDTAWLQVDRPSSPYPVLFNKTVRYANPYFPWPKVAAKYRGKAAFVGLADEHELFERHFGKIPFLPTGDLLELARLIAGCKLFVSNQSCPHAIAEGLKKNLVLEAVRNSHVCMFHRSGAINWHNTAIEFPDVE